jgi:hypothetical protein
MKRRIALLLLILGLWMPGEAASRHSYHTSRRCTSCVRDRRGHIRRDPHARSQFMKSHPCPSTGKTYGACPGYVVDHVVPLKRGGVDAPANMQWQTREAAKAKDRTE